ncbi:MAG TPA: hypothetical protein VNA69_04735 [Thermoanaerobaculia bacterium]|nr:hypothetical protein [Thermoanaerobaculia bacterium]
MSSDSVERLNLGLMAGVCIAAFAFPFQLFLFAYAILGPLHYLTEISWLHDHDYFAPRRTARRLWLAVVAAATAVLLYGFVSSEMLDRPVPPTMEIAMVYLVFAGAAMLVFVRHAVNAVALLIVTAAVIALSTGARAYALLAYFIVTIIHVLIFTAAFVLHGALKRKSAAAMWGLAVFTGCIVSFFVFSFVPAAGAPESLRKVYAFFEPLNVQLMALFGMGGGVYESRGGVAVMRLIAFAYTYHYLNWFSKTSIIRWHHVPHGRAVAIVASWAAAIALYLYDYALGLSFLYLLSLLHVLLEFPLNHKTFAGIGTELRALARA